ncbi:hybrid sensor histidine kinase/response regulator transcription factor [Dysgonomonas sp. BGC7]|uniref:hybrid sensor histidine kinase/response regulator transcription factor n=1 Tax=Dysgonomonas sp. BGC7 TaxID=1658008 RepID=UPI0009E30615|nr:hybrid sensor histidine kinase/response regulator transcription factor [Dysgonomonas sp. BGC7]MBD8387300.1 response regulator [Dysgonomonas sp. BGC7]
MTIFLCKMLNTLKSKNIFFLLFLFLSVFSESLADNSFDYRQLTDRYNQMSQSISNIVKDKDGFIWIASRSGISRYDGRNVKHYSLSESEIMQDKDGREVQIRKAYNGQLWAFTDSGKIFYYDSFSDSFVFALQTQTIFIHDLYLDEEGFIWIASLKGLLKYNSKDTAANPILTNEDLSINCIVSFSSALLAIGTTKGVYFIDKNSGKVDDKAIFDGHNIMSIYKDEKRHYLWAGSFSSGLFVWDLVKKENLDLPYINNIPSVPVKAIREWIGNSLLIGLDGRGVYKVDMDAKTSGSYLSNDDREGSILRANNVYDILVDDKNIWVGTYTGGVTIVKEPEIFEWIRHIPFNNQSVKGTHIYAILEDRDGDVWYATNLGVSFHDTKKNQWTHFLEEENSFLTLCEDNNGRIWTGGYSTGLYCIDKHRGVLRYIPYFQKKTQLECIYASVKDNDGDMWFGCLYSSLARMSLVDGKEVFSYYDIEQVKSIKVIDRNNLFVATSNGFVILNKHTGEKKRYFNSPAKYDIKSNTFVYSSVMIGDEIWFGTDGGGLNCMNLKTDKVDNFSTYNGLPSNYIYGILEDRQGLLWVSNSKGIFCFDPAQKRFLYNISNLPIKEFLFMSFTEFKDGRMAFGGTDGALIFNPKDIKRAELKAKLLFTDFRLFYQSITPKDAPEILPKPINELNDITLDYDQSSFSFGFIAIDLYNPDNYVYKYILEGFDKDWIPRGSALTADYTNISPGKYTFKIQCINKNDGQILAERKINVIVNEPFWNTIWAWIIYSLVFVSLVYWAWSFYRERMLKQQSKERINFFINVAHDIRTPLSLVLAPLSNLEEEHKMSDKGKAYLQLAKQNGEKLFSLVTQLLDFQKEEINPSRLSLSICDLKNYVNNKQKQFSPLAQDKGIAIHLELPADGIYIETDIKKLDRIVDNLLSNALKYSKEDSGIYLRLRNNDKKISLEVEDFGIGISKKEQKKIFKHIYRAENAVNSKEIGSGIGLMFTHKLVKQIKGELAFISEENKGTTFCLSFPIKDLGFVSPHTGIEEDTYADKEFYSASKRHFTESYRILLVEDNDDMRNYLTNILSDEYKLYSVSSAERALEFLKNNMTDLVVSDIMMDGMHGDELCRILKNNIETSHIHVILLTAIAEKDKMIHSLQYGADDYITKPFDSQVLKMKIHNFLQTRKKLQQYYLTKNNLAESTTLEDSAVDIEVGTTNIDEEFLNKCIQIVVKNMANSKFTVNDLCAEIAMSRTLVYEKLKALTNQSPNEFIRVIRLKQAKELLISKKYTIQEVALQTGFSDTKYFSTVFKKYYGTNPSKIVD